MVRPTQLPPKSKGDADAGAGILPLSALLSQTLVAFTIEFDNEGERRMQHRTTRHGASAGSSHSPWLVSMVMWINCMQFVGEEGVRVGTLEELARTKTNLNGMERWGLIIVAPDPADRRPKPPRRDWLIRATPAGRAAQQIVRPLFGIIEAKWRERYGSNHIDELRKALIAAVEEIGTDLPDCLPILGYGLFSQGPAKRRALAGPADADFSQLSLPALLARVLLAFAIEFECRSTVSLAISANVVRVLDEKGVRLRDLPRFSGVSKEAISMALGFLQNRRLVEIRSEQGSTRVKVVRLTPKGQEAQEDYGRLVGEIEEDWTARFGAEKFRALRESLERLVGEPGRSPSPLFRALEPHPSGWRASVPRRESLPHYPMVLHRGGFPDGS